MTKISSFGAPILGCIFLAADRMNGRFSRGTAAQYFSLLQQNLCCERTQLENKMTSLGLEANLRRKLHQGPLWAVHVERPTILDVDGHRDGQRIFKFEALVSDGAVHFGVTQQQLKGHANSLFRVDLGNLWAFSALRAWRLKATQ